MGLFGFFSREKKESLDKGLEKTRENFFTKLTKTFIGKSTIDDDVLDNLEEVLVTSDVGVETTLKIVTCTYSMCEGPVVCQFYVHVFFELMKSDWKYENHFRMSASHLSGLMEFIFATQIERLKLNDASTSAILARCRCGILPLLSCYCIQVCCFRRCLSLHILRF
jgi:hypothetical protein